MRKSFFIGAIVLSILLLVADPYSHGYRGGDVFVVKYSWQRWVAAIQAILLIVGAVRALHQYSHAVIPLAFEAGLFLGANAVYLWRDGFTRLVTGYESAPTTFWVLAAALLLRALLLARGRAEHVRERRR